METGKIPVLRGRLPISNNKFHWQAARRLANSRRVAVQNTTPRWRAACCSPSSCGAGTMPAPNGWSWCGRRSGPAASVFSWPGCLLLAVLRYTSWLGEYHPLTPRFAPAIVAARRLESRGVYRRLQLGLAPDQCVARGVVSRRVAGLGFVVGGTAATEAGRAQNGTARPCWR